MFYISVLLWVLVFATIFALFILKVNRFVFDIVLSLVALVAAVAVLLHLRFL